MTTVVIGGGMASVRLCEQLRTRGDREPIVLVSRETVPPYNRVLLSAVLAGAEQFTDTLLHDCDWYYDNNIDLVPGCTVLRIDAPSKSLRLSDGRVLHYDRVVLATGSVQRAPEFGKAADFLSFRTYGDCEEILRRKAGEGSDEPVIVVGGGLLGVEAAAALADRGRSVNLLHRGPWLMNRQLDEKAGEMLRDQLERRGIAVYVHAKPAAWFENRRGVRLADHRVVLGSSVILAAGIAPNIDLAKASGIATGNGVLVDANFRTSATDVYAVGECCELLGASAGLLAPVYEQIERLVEHLVSGEIFDSFEYTAHVVRLKVSGIDVHVMGDIRSCSDFTHFEDIHARIYRRLYFSGSRLVGALLFGDVSQSQKCFELLGEDLPSASRFDLNFSGTSLAA